MRGTCKARGMAAPGLTLHKQREKNDDSKLGVAVHTLCFPRRASVAQVPCCCYSFASCEDGRRC